MVGGFSSGHFKGEAEAPGGVSLQKRNPGDAGHSPGFSEVSTHRIKGDYLSITGIQQSSWCFYRSQF